MLPDIQEVRGIPCLRNFPVLQYCPLILVYPAYPFFLLHLELQVFLHLPDLLVHQKHPDFPFFHPIRANQVLQRLRAHLNISTYEFVRKKKSKLKFTKKKKKSSYRYRTNSSLVSNVSLCSFFSKNTGESVFTGVTFISLLPFSAVKSRTTRKTRRSLNDGSLLSSFSLKSKRFFFQNLVCSETLN